MGSPIEIQSCEVCGNKTLQPVLDLGLHPRCDDLVPIGDDRVCVESPIEILYCTVCATAHQRFQVPKLELFPSDYHYRSRFTADVLNGMKALVDSCEKRLGNLSGKTVLDIGCNDGSLLDFFSKKGCTTVGIEPTGAWIDGSEKGHHIYNAYFAPFSAEKILAEHGSPDIVTFTNVFAHIENLPELISALKILISKNTTLVIENHYLGSVLDRSQFDTFYHEHPRTYSFSSFLHISNTIGTQFCAVEFPSRYGGNIRVFLGSLPPIEDMDYWIRKMGEEESVYPEKFQQLQNNIRNWRGSMAKEIERLIGDNGRLFAKAFPGRAAILVKLLGLDATSIETVYEKPGSLKVGHYVPGTRIPIRSDAEFFAKTTKPEVILNLAWHISAEIHGYLRTHGFEGKIIDILTPEQFQ